MIIFVLSYKHTFPRQKALFFQAMTMSLGENGEKRICCLDFIFSNLNSFFLALKIATDRQIEFFNDLLKKLAETSLKVSFGWFTWVYWSTDRCLFVCLYEWSGAFVDNLPGRHIVDRKSRSLISCQCSLTSDAAQSLMGQFGIKG